MPTLTTVGILLLLLVGVLLAAHLRRRLLQRRSGTVELSLRLHHPTPGRGWMLGMGRFRGDDLQWYRVFSLAPGPRRTLSRRDLVVERQREAAGGETLALLSGAVVLECRGSAGPVELAMDRDTVTGFLAWLEAAPPGATLPSTRAVPAASARRPVATSRRRPGWRRVPG